LALLGGRLGLASIPLRGACTVSQNRRLR
jgi:hypothetical protein